MFVVRIIECVSVFNKLFQLYYSTIYYEKVQERLQPLLDKITTDSEVELKVDNELLNGDHLKLLNFETDSKQEIFDQDDDLFSA